MIEALVDAVVDGAVGEQAREAAPAGVEKVLVALDVEVGLVRARKAHVGKVFGSRRRAHGQT